MFVEVWQESEGRWLWRYVDPTGDGGRPYELPSAEDYPTGQAAIEAAATAYPGVPVRRRDTVLHPQHPASATGAAARLRARARNPDARGPGGRLVRVARRAGTFALLVVSATAISRWRRHRRLRRERERRDPA